MYSVEKELVVPMEVLGVERKHREWLGLLNGSHRGSARWCMYDGEFYDPLGLLLGGVLGRQFELANKVHSGIDFGLLWSVMPEGLSFLPPAPVLSEMRLDRVVDRLDWMTIRGHFGGHGQEIPREFGLEGPGEGLSRCCLLQKACDAGLSHEEVAEFMLEAGWGTILDLLQPARCTDTDFGPLTLDLLAS